VIAFHKPHESTGVWGKPGVSKWGGGPLVYQIGDSHEHSKRRQNHGETTAGGLDASSGGSTKLNSVGIVKGKPPESKERFDF